MISPKQHCVIRFRGDLLNSLPSLAKSHQTLQEISFIPEKFPCFLVSTRQRRIIICLGPAFLPSADGYNLVHLHGFFINCCFREEEKARTYSSSLLETFSCFLQRLMIVHQITFLLSAKHEMATNLEHCTTFQTPVTGWQSESENFTMSPVQELHEKPRQWLPSSLKKKTLHPKTPKEAKHSNHRKVKRLTTERIPTSVWGVSTEKSYPVVTSLEQYQQSLKESCAIIYHRKVWMPQDWKNTNLYLRCFNNLSHHFAEHPLGNIRVRPKASRDALFST